MNYLLDTHTFLWAVFPPEKLSRKARMAIADTGNAIHSTACWSGKPSSGSMS